MEEGRMMFRNKTCNCGLNFSFSSKGMLVQNAARPGES